MKIETRLGNLNDLKELEGLYDDLNDHLATNINYPGWKKGIYPTRQDALAGIQENSLFVATIDGKIAGTLILRHKPEEAYRTATWQMDLTDEEVFVIYTFAVHPAYAKQGVGQALLEFAKEYGRKMGVKALRLDVVDRNIPAIKLYEKCGFTYVATVDLGLHAYGLDWFKLYEKLL